MDLSNEVLAVLVGIALVAIAFLVALFRRLSRADVQAFVEQHSPDELRALLLWASLKAYDAVAQIAEQYEAMTDEEKQALAEQMIRALLDLVLRGKSSPLASKALLESGIRETKHADVSLTARAGAAPSTEAVPKS